MATKTPQISQPAPPVILMSADALAAVWSPHAGVVATSQHEGEQAVPFERDAAEKRATASAHRQEADRLIALAAELEADANRDVKNAQYHRQNEEHHANVARQIATNVAWLAETNNLTHPADVAHHAQQTAAANAAAPSALDVPLDQLDRMVASSSDPSQTAPFAAQVSR